MQHSAKLTFVDRSAWPLAKLQLLGLEFYTFGQHRYVSWELFHTHHCDRSELQLSRASEELSCQLVMHKHVTLVTFNKLQHAFRDMAFTYQHICNIQQDWLLLIEVMTSCKAAAAGPVHATCGLELFTWP